MTEEEIKATVWNVLRLEGQAKELAKLPTNELKGVLKRVRSIIEGMPDGGIERELAYKQIQYVLRDTFDLPAKQLSVDISSALPAEAVAQVEWAANYLGAPVGTANSVQAAAMAAVGDTRVLNATIENLAEPMSNSMWKRVDKTVRQGFLEGQTNNQISNAVGQTYKASKAEIRAIARTAVMSLAQESHNQFWDANSEVIEGWRWDASFDYRVCPICAPLDGKKVKKRSELATPPVHPNCRCMVLPITGIESDTGNRSITELRKDKPVESDTVRVYKQKVRGDDGGMYWKVVTEMPSDATMGDFINRANNLTQENILGKRRAARFRKLVKGTPGARAKLTPQEALVRVTKDNMPAPRVRKPPSATRIAARAEKKAIAKLKVPSVKPATVARPSAGSDTKGVNPISLFNESTNSLGRGGFGEARLTPKGVVKKGWLNRAEISAMEKLGDTGVTPKLLGYTFEGEWKPKLFPGMNVRRGYMLMEQAPGESLQKLIQFGGGLTEKQGASAFESLMKARKKIHLGGVAHQDMHPGNILLDLKSKKLTVIDMGLSRVDSRAALVEALGVMPSPIGIIGDFQSSNLFTYFNEVSGAKKSETWKRFRQNRKSVIAKLEAEGAGQTANASIRTLPKAVTDNLTSKRALELLEELYEGI